MTHDPSSILVVDDEKEMRKLLQDILEEEQYRVVVASDGQEALAHMESEKFPVVVTDLRMKGLDGLGLLAQVVQKHPESNLIMMTAFGTVESAVEAMKQGAFDYLTKPVKADELLVDGGEGSTGSTASRGSTTITSTGESGICV